MLSRFSCVWLFGTLWTVAHQAILPMGISRQEYQAQDTSRHADCHRCLGKQAVELWETLPQSFSLSGKQGISPRPLFLSESNQETETTWAFINSNFKTGNKLHG